MKFKDLIIESNKNLIAVFNGIDEKDAIGLAWYISVEFRNNNVIVIADEENLKFLEDIIVENDFWSIIETPKQKRHINLEDIIRKEIKEYLFSSINFYNIPEYKTFNIGSLIDSFGAELTLEFITKFNNKHNFLKNTSHNILDIMFDEREDETFWRDFFKNVEDDLWEDELGSLEVTDLFKLLKDIPNSGTLVGGNKEALEVYELVFKAQDKKIKTIPIKRLK